VGAWVEFELKNFDVAQRRLGLGRACNSVQGDTATLAFTATLALWVCNLQNPKDAVGFESTLSASIQLIDDK
jgi:hypothetical protein